MSTNNKLKAFVRFDGTGRVISGSLILQKNKPKVGNWQEIDANECCNPPAPCIDVLIGTQTWTTCNLNVSTYRNGDIIPEVTNPLVWAGLTTGAWCYYANTSSNGTTYGKLYNWYAVNDPRGLAPVGYHIPTETELDTLFSYLGGTSVAGGKMKSTGTSLWSAPNTDATNISGFTGFPGGLREFDGSFDDVTLFGNWWSATQLSISSAWYSFLQYGTGVVTKVPSSKEKGYSVRLIKD